MDIIQQHIPEVVAVTSAVFALMLPTWILGFLCKWVILGLAALNLTFAVYDRVRDKVKPLEDDRGRYAVVTGASGGIGEHMAHSLAKRKFNVVLVARGEDSLRTIADALSAAYQIQTKVLPLDLTTHDAAEKLLEYLETENIEPEVLVNNAGFGMNADVVDLDADILERMLSLNVIVLTKLSHHFAAKMAKKGCGRIINISSTAGFAATPHEALYSATKSFVTGFTLALDWELRSTGVSATVVCPGATRTKFGEVSGVDKGLIFRLKIPGLVMSAEEVAEAAVVGGLTGSPVVVPGFMNIGYMLVSPYLPRKFLLWFLQFVWRAR